MKKGWRKCRKCGVPKGPGAYSTKGRTHGAGQRKAKGAYICTTCWRKARRERERELARWRRYGRDCPRCGQRRKVPDDIGVAYNAVCRQCKNARKAENARKHYHEDPQANQLACRKWRAANPGKAAAASQRWRQKRAKVWRYRPDLRKKHLELRRIDERLRRERKGHQLKVDQTHVSEGPEFPVGPLFVALERLRERYGIDVDSSHNDDGYVAFCEYIGVSDRTMREWRLGARTMIRLSTADRIFQNVGWHWWDVYVRPVNGHAGDAEAWEAYRAASMAFEGEVVE